MCTVKILSAKRALSPCYIRYIAFSATWDWLREYVQNCDRSSRKLTASQTPAVATDSGIRVKSYSIDLKMLAKEKGAPVMKFL
jgi:hypothetical protein